MFTLTYLVLVVAAACTAWCRPSGGNQYGSASYSAPSYGNGNALSAYEEPAYEERNYKVYYSVKDDPSYNFQTRDEQKNGKTVSGQYTVLEPTGELRVVKYVADENGFRADVQNQAGYAQPYVQPEYNNRVQASKSY